MCAPLALGIPVGHVNKWKIKIQSYDRDKCIVKKRRDTSSDLGLREDIPEEVVAELSLDG